jgi:hypothetical protein
MRRYFIDFIIASVLIVGITALMGVIANGIGERIFGGSKRKEHVNESKHIQNGWNLVGGKNKTIS